MIAQNAIPMTLSIHRIEGHCVSGEEDRPTDAELLDAVRNGDKEAYRKLFRRFAAEIVAVCHRILNDRDEAEDVATEVFWEMWRRSDRYDPARATPRGYLVMMARKPSNRPAAKSRKTTTYRKAVRRCHFTGRAGSFRSAAVYLGK